MKKLLSAVTVLVLALLLVACGPKAPKKYQVTFDSDGGTAVPIKIVEDGDKVAKPNPDPTKADFTFKFWMEGTTEFDFNTAITKDTTLVAKWEAAGDNVPEDEKFKVTFDSGVAEQLVVKGQKATKPTNPTKEGFTFKHWALKGETTAFDFNTPVTKALELVAVWDENSTGGGGEEQGQLIHNYDFTTLKQSTSYVREETDTEVKNLVSNTDSTFVRMNANISQVNGGAKGIVLGIREGNGWENPYLTTPKLEGAKKVEFTLNNWSSDQHFQKDYAKNIFLQTSVDGKVWTDEKDVKADLNTEQFGKTTVTLDLDGSAVYVRLYIVSNGAQDPATGNDGKPFFRQYRIIVSDFKAWN